MFYRQIKYFVTVVDTGSFTEAAERCYISQSAVSQQIQALEHELGVLLLKRENRKFYLTPADEYFYRCGKRMLAEAARVKTETARIGKYGSRSLKAGYLKNYCGSGLYLAVAEFTQKYPGVELEITSGSHEELYDALRGGSLDVVLNDQRRAFSDEYVNFLLACGGWYIELAARNALASQNSVELAELADVPCILAVSPDQREKERDFYAHTLGFADNFIFATSIDEARLLAAAGMGYLPADGGVTAMPPGLVRLPLMRGGEQMLRNYCAFWKKGNDNPYVSPFAQMLRQKLLEETANA